LVIANIELPLELRELLVILNKAVQEGLLGTLATLGPKWV
jgi:hypothetical protein